MTRIIVWRHGQTDYNLHGRFQGQTDIPLNATGRAQAAAAAGALAGQGITRIFASDLARAHETARTLGTLVGLEVETNPHLREISVGEWEGLTREEIAEVWPDQLEAWTRGVDMRPPGGESRKESAERVTAAIHEIVAKVGPDDTVAVVAHGAVLRGAAEELLNMGPEAGHLGVLPNCGYGILSPRHGRWVLGSWGLHVEVPAN